MTWGGDRTVAYWRSLGSPVIDRNAPGYVAPWFPWADAGFEVAEVASYDSMWVSVFPAATTGRTT